MLRTITVFLMAVCVLAYSSAVPVSAQTDQAKRDRRAAEVKAKIAKIGTGEKARVKVKLYDNTRYEGQLREVTDSGFVVVTKEGNPHTVNYSDVRSIGGRNLSTGAKIGIGIGIGAGITVLAILLIIANLEE
jgi:hypothetical protein